jgi:nitroreductase
MNYLDALNWRYATKKMDPAKRVDDLTVERILEAARLAPTSSGLQPFSVVLVTNPEVKQRLAAAAFGQSQVLDCSHLLVFAAWDDYTEARISAVYDLIAAERGGVTPGMQAYRDRLLATTAARPAAENFPHTARQAYLAMGFALAAAALEGVDSTPMEGFDPDQVDTILGLRERGLRSVTLLALGYRDEANDWLAPLKKVRRARKDLVIEIP